MTMKAKRKPFVCGQKPLGKNETIAFKDNELMKLYESFAKSVGIDVHLLIKHDAIVFFRGQELGYEQGKKALEEVLKDIKEMEHFADDVDNCLLISYHEVIDKLEQKLKELSK